MFVRRAIDVPLGYSREDLESLLPIASEEQPALVRLIEDYLRLMERSESDIRPSKKRPPRSQMHLFDLLREKKFFPQNLDLARFAEKVLPQLSTHRFDKMSRGDMAARIIEHLEDTDPRTRDRLEVSMRNALAEMSGRPKKEEEVTRKSFLSRWERIIKGIEL
jgi:hypothetical protein